MQLVNQTEVPAQLLVSEMPDEPSRGGMAVAKATFTFTIVLTGMHPDIPTFSFLVPPPPTLAFSLDEPWKPATPRLHSVLLLPGRKKLQLVYGASHGPLGRKYVPGVHAKIPLAMRVNRDVPIVYQAPPTVGQAYQAARDAASTTGKS